jgi:superfamily II helicase
MKFLCRHCDQMITGKRYRVLSQEDGVTLLDMIVCHSCRERAKELGLRAEEIGPMMNRAKRLAVAADSTSRITL